MPLPARSLSYNVRKLHRYLGLFIGIQFLLWTAGGLYFSWTDLDRVHGDHLHVPRPRLRAEGALVSPTQVLDAIRRGEPVDSLATVELVRVMDAPVYRLAYFTRTPAGVTRRVRLADARTGALRPPVSRDEAIRMARAEFAHAVPLRTVEYLTPATVGKHHEYREQPLPAWAVSFDHPSGATAYVGAETGTVVRIRHGQWRTFDFLWMLHTMDYQGRDDINNLVLRAFSVLGLVTISSGFILFWLTSRPYLNRARRKGRAVDPAS
jgi:uncharacterized iron-regulated membrane protein